MSLSTVAGGLTAAVAPRESKRRSQRNLIPNQGMVESSYGCVFVKLGRACTVAHHSSKPSTSKTTSLSGVRETENAIGARYRSARLKSPAMKRDAPLAFIASLIALRPFSMPALRLALAANVIGEEVITGNTFAQRAVAVRTDDPDDHVHASPILRTRRDQRAPG